MRVVNMQHYRVLLKGQEWTGSLPPCAKEAMALLENNEEIVSWLAPIDGDGTCARHVPAVRYKGQYWTISLRMSKSIYRSVRLRQGFENVQTVHGVQTLRIPTLLFNEKQRTQARFKVSSCVILRQCLSSSTPECCCAPRTSAHRRAWGPSACHLAPVFGACAHCFMNVAVCRI
jgi:hypothetical protein